MLSSSALWWLLLGAIIIFFHLLKLKRRRAVVPSIILWKRALEELEANAPFKKLRRSLLLLLQLLALAALVFALARPAFVSRALASGSTIIVIDSTASMSARDEDGSRLDRAKQLAREMLEGLGGGDRAAIIENSSRVAVKSPLTSDLPALESAVNDIQETDAPGTLDDALRLASQIAKSEREATVVVIGDGGGSFIEPSPDSPISRPSLPPSDEASIRFVRVGRRSDNVGIVAMNTRQLSANNGQEMFASVADFSGRARSIGVELRVEGKLIDARRLDLAENERRGLVFESLPREGGLAELSLDCEDDLASDNIAYAFVPAAGRVRVGVVSDNQFLLQALAVNPDIDASKISPTASTNGSDFDCLIIDGAFVGKPAEGVPVLAIDPPDSAGLWRATGQRERPEVTYVERSHPVNNFLNYADLHIESVNQREAASWLRPIASAGNDPVIWAGDDGHRRIVLIGFNLARTDLPLKIEFPILLANSVSWLVGGDGPSIERAVRAGHPVTIHTSAPAAIISNPAGDSREIEARDGSAVFAETMRVGTYVVKDAPSFAASLLSEGESDTAPRDSIRIRAGAVNGHTESFSSERELWRWIAVLGLALLMAEWWAYHKRIS
ncbi:MAG: VWA domain-containing protein [Blastocatellia bacterium]